MEDYTWDMTYDDDMNASIIDHTDFSSLQSHDEDFGISDDEDAFLDEVMDEYHQGNSHTTFRGHDSLPPNANSDGYIPNGHQELTSTISEIHTTFKLYSKGGHDYVLYNGRYYQIDGTGTVTIGGIKYDKI